MVRSLLKKPAIPPDPLDARVAKFFDGLRNHTSADGRSNVERAIDDICALVLVEDYHGASQILYGENFSDAERKVVRNAVNRHFMAEKEQEWNLHGAVRTFRFWSNEEKTRYLRHAMEAASAIRGAGYNAAIGFGAVLAYKRDGDMIPHDDDLDIIVGIPAAVAPTLTQAKQLTRSALEAAGYKTDLDFPSHFKITTGQEIDVFVGLEEGDRVSWFPSHRKNLAIADVFPPAEVDFFGVPCLFPRNIDSYIEVTYGADWRTPVPYWNHPWDKAEFEDIL